MRRASRLALGLIAMAGSVAAGCGKSQADIDSSINTAIQEMMVKRTPQQRAIEALQTDNADERRKLLRKVLKDKRATAEWAVKVFASVAKTDPDPQVRCIAIKGLRQSADSRVAEPLLMILNHKDFPKKVTPPPNEVRWDATEVLAHIADLGEIPEEHWDWSRRTFIRLVTDDPDRNVRICAAQGLRNYPHPGALSALTRALEGQDFAIRHEAEGSLEALTGQRFDYDADAWREWLEKNPNPFLPSDRAWSEPDGPPIGEPME